MYFSNNRLIADSHDITWYWESNVKPFATFMKINVLGEIIDFSHSLDYFDLTSDTAENLRRIGEPYDFIENPLPIALNNFTIFIFEGFNDANGIGSILSGFTNDSNHIVLVKRIIPVYENGNLIKYGKTDSGREYKTPSWGVRGHQRRLSNGRVIQVKPYTKGKERNNSEYYNPKEYRFLEDKIDDDSK